MKLLMPLFAKPFAPEIFNETFFPFIQFNCTEIVIEYSYYNLPSQAPRIDQNYLKKNSQTSLLTKELCLPNSALLPANSNSA